jgi:hypothetical protein
MSIQQIGWSSFSIVCGWFTGSKEEQAHPSFQCYARRSRTIGTSKRRPSSCSALPKCLESAISTNHKASSRSSAVLLCAGVASILCTVNAVNEVMCSFASASSHRCGGRAP